MRLALAITVALVSVAATHVVADEASAQMPNLGAVGRFVADYDGDGLGV